MDLPRLDPGVRLYGTVDETMLQNCLDQLDAASKRDDPVVLELTTLGGDADIARRIGLEMRLLRESGRRITRFVGKSAVYSAGVTIMASFAPGDRFLTRDTRLLIHGRRVDKQVKFSGPLRESVGRAKRLIAEFENGLAAEEEDFAALIVGTRIDREYLMERAASNWYLTAREALDLGLVAGVI
jgi:ATP-dependent Clp protease, protease subunit